MFQNKECRIAIYENQQWMPTTVLFGLAGCSIPAGLKAQILLTLAALGKSPEIAASLWQNLEASQVLAINYIYKFFLNFYMIVYSVCVQYF